MIINIIPNFYLLRIIVVVEFKKTEIIEKKIV